MFHSAFLGFGCGILLEILHLKVIAQVTNTSTSLPINSSPGQNTSAPTDIVYPLRSQDDISYATSTKLIIVLSIIATMMLVAIFCLGLRFTPAHRMRTPPSSQSTSTVDTSDTVVMVLDPSGRDSIGVRIVKTADGWWIPNETSTNALLDRYMEPLPTYSSSLTTRDIASSNTPNNIISPIHSSNTSNTANSMNASPAHRSDRPLTINTTATPNFPPPAYSPS